MGVHLVGSVGGGRRHVGLMGHYKAIPGSQQLAIPDCQLLTGAGPDTPNRDVGESSLGSRVSEFSEGGCWSLRALICELLGTVVGSCDSCLEGLRDGFNWCDRNSTKK